MDSVRALEKLAFAPEYPLIRTIDLYGQSAQIWPVMYFAFAFEAIDLQTIANNLAARQISRPLDRRIDMICVLDQGVICNCPPDQSMYVCVPTPGSLLATVRTKKALLLFYTLLSVPLSRVWMPVFQFAKYLGQMTFAITKLMSERLTWTLGRITPDKSASRLWWGVGDRMGCDMHISRS